MVQVKTLVKLYIKEKYILFVSQHESTALELFITFKVDATGLSVMKSLWQAHWLYEHPEIGSYNVFARLKKSLMKLDSGFTAFIEQLEEAGWDQQQINLKVPKELIFEEE